MKLVIDSLDNVTGWTVNAPSTVETIQFPELIAGLNSDSLQFKIDSADLTRTITKIISPGLDVSKYQNLIFSVWSQNYGRSIMYRKPTDFYYKITLDGINEYYVPIYCEFQDINIGIENVDTISEITITALHDTTDYIVISEMIAEKEETNYDLLNSVKEALEFDITAELDNGIQVYSGFSGTTGDTELLFPSGVNYLDRYAVIKIIEGATEETHQLGNNTETGFTMLTLFDGMALVNTFTSAEVYIQFPVIINPTEQEAHIPGVSVWGITPEEIFPTFKTETQFETFLGNGSFTARTKGQDLNYTVLIDCEARDYELLALISRIVRIWIGKEIVWINGRRHDVSSEGAPQEIRPAEGINIIPKNQYSCSVPIEETLYKRQNIPAVTTVNTIVTPER